MGLAASQARLLTLTSRLSSIELRQQAIANSKILLANDSEEVSNKYTKALNNQTLKMSDGTNEIPMTYDALKSFGYDVRRTGDGVVASAAQSSGAKPASGTNPNQNANVKKTSAIIDPEVLKWVGKSAPTPPTIPTTNLQQLLANPPKEETAYDYSASSAEVINKALYYADISLNPKKYGYKGIKMITSQLSNYINMRAQYPELISNLSKAKNEATAKGDTDTANKYEKLIQKAKASYQNCLSKNKFSSSSLERHVTARVNELREILTEMNNIQANLNANASSNFKTRQAEYQKNVEKARKEDSEYNAKRAEYERDVNNWALANSGKVDTQDGTSSVGGAGGGGASAGASGSASGSSSNPQAQALAQQLKSNPQFLIQGLLSGYLTLVKDGQDVSISSATNILEQYDKSDDAAAEAEYNAQMAKINRKEKMLDQQMKNLDTEHSAMQQEVESIKSIIKNHAEKDFNLFG